MPLLIKLTAVQTFMSQTLYSIFHYEPIGANVPNTGSNFNVLNDNLLSAAVQLYNKYNTVAFRAVLSTQWTLNRVDAVYEGTTQADRDALPGNFATTPGAAVSGTATGEYLPAFVTSSVRFNRPDASVRHGYKRLSGHTEADQVDGSLVAGSRTAVINWATSVLSLDKVGTYGSAADSCRYVCIRKEANGQPLPAWRYLPALSVFVRAQLSSQRTRKLF